MKNLWSFLAILFVLYGSPIGAQCLCCPHYYMPEELKQDLSALKKALEANHPGLYTYTDKLQIESTFASLYHGIQNPMTEQQFYCYLSPILTQVRDVNTELLRSKKELKKSADQGLYFPFKTHWDGKKLYITENYSKENGIQAGTEITLINKEKPAELIPELQEMISRDGLNTSHLDWYIDHNFARVYSLAFRHPPKFRMQVKAPDGKKSKLVVDALTRKEISRVKSAKYKDESAKLLRFDIQPDSRRAVLTLSSFDDRQLRKHSGQKFESFIKESFLTIAGSNVDHLVIDLRDNSGGSFQNAQYLLSFLMDRPYRLVRKVEKVHKAYGQKRNKSVRQRKLKLNQVLPDGYKGKVYVLTNGGTLSCAAMAAACLDYYWRGTIIGEESGGSNRRFCGKARKHTLPNTKIRVSIPTRQYYIIEEKENLKHGVSPEYHIPATLQAILSDSDDALDFALRMTEINY